MASPLARSTAQDLSQRPSRRIRRAFTTAAALAVALTSLAASGSSTPASAACGSFQSRVNNAATGSTITIPRCTFHEEVTVRKRLTINAYGVTIDAGGRAHGLLIEANDVTVNGVTVTNASGGDHDGAVHTNGISRFTLRRAVIKDSATVCLSLNGGTGHRILNTTMRSCGKEGYFGNALSNTLFKGNLIHHNNVNRAWDPQSEAGGGKVMASTGITFDGNSVWANGGPGIWFDNGVKNAVVRYNRVRDNYESGIMFEVSSGAKIYGNTVYRNGFGHAVWGFGPGILISSSDNADIHGNLLAWNARGISVISQDRQLSPHTGNRIHNNVIISKTGSFVTGFYDDHGGSSFSSSSGNRGYDNRYWIGVRQPSGDRFAWNGSRSTLTAYNATQGEARGKYISTAARNKILKAWKVPLS